MLVVDLDDRELLASVFRRNAPAHAYELGDLDDFDWPHTVWFGWESEGRLEEVALLYTQPRIPVLIAIAEPPATTMAELLTAITWSLPYDEAYPGTWFVPRMLATGRYVGLRRDGRLACVAGVHVYSPAWRVAALGNVATLPEVRGQGLARGVCASLCRLLLADGIEAIALNVRADNVAAIASYTRLGFEPVAEYVEASLVARTVGG